MKLCVLVIAIVIQTITYEKAGAKLQRKLIAPEMNEYCKKIKCPAVEDPQCVRLRRHDLNLTFHMIVVNKCELEYLKCHDDVEGKIVPLKFCGQHAVLTAEKHKNVQGSAHFRPKRTAIFSKPSAVSKISKAVKQKISKNQKINNPKLNHKRRRRSQLQGLKRMQRRNEIRSHRQMLRRNGTRSHRQMLRRNGTRGHARMQRKNHSQKWLRKHARQAYGYFFSSETDSDFETNEKKRLQKGIGGYHVNIDEEQQSQLKPKSLSPSKDFKHMPLKHKEDKRTTRPSFPMFSEETLKNYGKKTSREIDREQYAAACPTVCPSRDVMVCGKCQHEIYRTFSSDCHLRMYGCMHPKENVQLISRVPCVQSSPFLSEPGFQPQGRIAGPEDDDVVLRFIRCRDMGLLEHQKTSAEQRNADPFLAGYKYLKELNHYYKYHETKMNWDKSKETCEQEEASLYYPENEVEYHALIEFWKKYETAGANAANTWIYLGIRNFTGWHTIYGQPISEVYVNWRPGQPDNAGGIEHCAHMDNMAVFNDIPCHHRFNFICKKSVPTSADQTNVDPFLASYKYLEEVNFYSKYHKTPLSWDQSKEACEQEHASLYYPETEAEAHALIKFWKKHVPKMNWIYVGIRKFRGWQTIDRKPITEAYVKWQPGQPDNNRGIEDCMQLNQQGLCNDVPCAREFSFICKKIVPTSGPIEQHDVDDPRCNFELAKETLKLHDYKGANVVFDKQLLHDEDEYSS